MTCSDNKKFVREFNTGTVIIKTWSYVGPFRQVYYFKTIHPLR